MPVKQGVCCKEGRGGGFREHMTLMVGKGAVMGWTQLRKVGYMALLCC